MSTYAIIETGAKQYRVEPETVLDVELLDLDGEQKEVTLDKVLLVRNGDAVQVGTPVVKTAKVICDLIGTVRGRKVVSYRYRRRKDSQKIRGHRQTYTRLKVREIQA